MKKNINNNEKLGIIGNLRKFFIIEPLLILWILPGCFNYVAIQNLGLEKACRVNLNYSQDVCENMLDKSIRNIECEEESENEVPDNQTSNIIQMNKSNNFSLIVCKAEIETQKLVTISTGIRGPIASIFPIIVILFAGGWSDRHNLRKPCMLFPLIGEALASTALLISSIFFESIPMEFGNILEKVLPSMFGGFTLMMMGIFSYLTATTEEKDRTFRFGIFGICAGIIPLVGLPISGTLYNKLGYINVFALGIIFLIIAILYLIYLVDELPPPSANKEINDIKNIKLDNTDIKSKETYNMDVDTSLKVKKSCLMEFFDPKLAYECIKVLTKERERRGRLFLILIILSYALFIGPALAEIEYLFQYIKIKLTWSDDEFSIFNTYSSAIGLCGTFLMTSVFSKLLHMSDPMVGLLSAIGTVISRPFYAFAKGFITFYAGQTFDMFVSAKTIAIKTMASSLVEEEELGRLYSILGIFEAISNAIFPPIYSAVYSSTLDYFPGAFYLFGEIFFIPTALLFGVCYFVFKPLNNSAETKNTEDNSKNVGNNSEATETSYL